MSTLATTPSDQAARTSAEDAGGAERLERQLFVALLGGMLLLAAWISKYLGIQESVADIPALIGALILVIPLAKGAVGELREGRASSDSLASLAVFAAIANELYLAAGFLAFFLWFSELVLSRTAWGAQRAIRNLLELTPDIARIVGADGAEREVGLAQVAPGTIVRVRPGENLPADGVVRGGTSSINQASLTGEAVPIEVQPGASVYAGTTNLTGRSMSRSPPSRARPPSARSRS